MDDWPGETLYVTPEQDAMYGKGTWTMAPAQRRFMQGYK